MIDIPTKEVIRNCAVLLLAADIALMDKQDPEIALLYARRIEKSVDNDPLWANGRHEGDCTKQPHTCHRCLLEDMEDRALELWNN